MALIETVTGVTKIHDSLYEVTAIVELGSGIDDLYDATIVSKDGGILKVADGCTTTFTRCHFIETDTAKILPFDHYFNSGDPTIYPRWGGKSQAVFKGCTWTCYQDSAFDAHALQECTFERDEYGRPCVLQFPPGTGVRTLFNASNANIDGLVFEMDTRQLAFGEEGNTFNDISIEGTQPLKVEMTFAYPEFSPQGDGIYRYTYRGLKVSGVDVVNLRNDVAPNLRKDSILKLIDPIGRIEKTSAPDTSPLEVYRTWGNTFFDTSGNPVSNVRSLISKSGQNEFDLTGATNEAELLQFTQGVGSLTVVTEPSYTVNTIMYGYQAQSTTFSVPDATDVNALKATTVLFDDLNITKTLAQIESTTQATSTADLYDMLKYYQYAAPDVEEALLDFVTVDNDTLDFGSYSVYFGDFTNTVTFFDNTYTTPVGETPGSEASSGYSSTVTPTSLVENHVINFSSSEFSGYGTWGGLFLKDVNISTDGTKMIWAFHSGSDGGGYLVDFTLSTPFDITTATKGSVKKLPSTGGSFSHISITHGEHIFVQNDSSGAWYYYQLTTPYTLPAGDVTLTQSGSGNGWGQFTGYQHAWSNDGHYVYKFQNNSGAFYCRRAYCSTAWDMSTAGGFDYFQAASEVSGAHDTSLTGSSQYVRAQGISMKWIDDNTVFLASGATNKYTILTTATANELVASDFTGAVYQTLPSPDAEGYHGWATIANGSIYSWHPAAAGSTSLDYTLDVASAILTTLVGAPNSLFISSTGIISSGNGFDKIRTTDYFYTQDGVTLGVQTIDANGIQSTVEIKGINPGTEVRMYKTSDDTEVAAVESSTGSSVTLGYTFITPEDHYIVIHSQEYTTSPRLIDFTTQPNSSVLTVFQQLDRAYINP